MKQYIFSPLDESYKVSYLTNGVGDNDRLFINEIKSEKAGNVTPGLLAEGQAIGLFQDYLETTVQLLKAKAIALDMNLRVYEDRHAAVQLNTKLANFLSFSSGVAEEKVVIDTVAKTVAIEVPALTVVTALACEFTTNTLTSIKINSTVQVSGVTTNNFSSPKVYRLMAADGVTYKDYTVTVTVAS